MADIKISELTSVSSLNNGDLVEVSQVNELAPSGYTSLKASMADIGKKVNTDIEYTTDLADFTDKTTLGAIKETAKGKNIADEYDDTQTYDKGDVVIYKNTLYICTTNNTTGTWDATKWTATTVQSLIGSLSSLTTTNKDSLVDAVNEVDGGKLDKSTYTENTSVTINSLVATGAVYTKKIGNMVMVWGLVTTTASITTGTAILTGMFMNNNGANNVVKFIDNNGTSPDWVLYTPNANNVLLSASSQSSGHSYTVSFIYYSA